MDEAELVRRMIANDKEAFDALMKRYQEPALRTAYLISGSYADSEDIVQETFVACYLKRKQIKDPEAFRGWFYKTLSRTAWRLCKKKRREQPAEEIFPEMPEGPAGVEGIEQQIVLREEDSTRYEAMMDLPVQQRTVLFLFYFVEMPVKEIARVCGCLEGTVKSRLFHGKLKLKQTLLENQHEGGRAWTILS